MQYAHGASIELAIRQQPADEVDRHAARGIPHGSDRDAERHMPGMRLEIGEQRRLGGQREERRRDRAGREQGGECVHARFCR